MKSDAKPCQTPDSRKWAHIMDDTGGNKLIMEHIASMSALGTGFTFSMSQGSTWSAPGVGSNNAEGGRQKLTQRFTIVLSPPDPPSHPHVVGRRRRQGMFARRASMCPSHSGRPRQILQQAQIRQCWLKFATCCSILSQIVLKLAKIGRCWPIWGGILAPGTTVRELFGDVWRASGRQIPGNA